MNCNKDLEMKYSQIYLLQSWAQQISLGMPWFLVSTARLSCEHLWHRHALPIACPPPKMQQILVFELGIKSSKQAMHSDNCGPVLKMSALKSFYGRGNLTLKNFTPNSSLGHPRGFLQKTISTISFNNFHFLFASYVWHIKEKVLTGSDSNLPGIHSLSSHRTPSILGRHAP